MTLVSLPITALYAALSGFLIIALAANVVRLRLAKKVSLGDGGHKDVSRAIRAHGNTIEYLPLALILMALLEINGGSSTALHSYGILLVGGRVVYSYGMLVPRSSANLARQLGVVTSWLVILGAGIQLLVI
ncbi:MAPEG family protein [uncultured Alcanivorax sp.]|uniref:MAPEG family protein n=1 Tax=uncultured Alcanivorax sp. TaxID=191215 RepID=UPI00262DC8A7|nr:MAPEG family protein [uncultured Alcanivorax sp.]MEE2602401.1 MAPEG family protein [Pseudomonadota bacterium]